MLEKTMRLNSDVSNPDHDKRARTDPWKSTAVFRQGTAFIYREYEEEYAPGKSFVVKAVKPFGLHGKEVAAGYGVGAAIFAALVDCEETDGQWTERVVGNPDVSRAGHLLLVQLLRDGVASRAQVEDAQTRLNQNLD